MPVDESSPAVSLTAAEAARFLACQAILTGAAPPEVYAELAQEVGRLRARVVELEAENARLQRQADSWGPLDL